MFCRFFKKINMNKPNYKSYREDTMSNLTETTEPNFLGNLERKKYF